MTIEYLADHREFVPTVAQWYHSEWGNLRPNETVKDRVARVERDCGHCQIPTTFVALADGQVLGAAELIEHDITTRPELSPWLAGVFVFHAIQRRGDAPPFAYSITAFRGNWGILNVFTLRAQHGYVCF